MHILDSYLLQGLLFGLYEFNWEMQDLLILRLMAVINGVLFTLEKYEY